MSTLLDSEAPLTSSLLATDPLLTRLDEILSSLCSQRLAEVPDSTQREIRVTDLVEFLDSISASVIEEGSEEKAVGILSRLNGFIQSTWEDQDLVDAMSYELPKSVPKFASASKRCLEIAETIIVSLARHSNPRDMLPMLCEALGSSGDMYKEPSYFAPLLSGISQVFMLIRRRQFEHVKTAVPIILRVLKVMSLELIDEELDLEVLFYKAICIADSVKAVSDKLEGKDKNKLHALVGLFVLQIVALATMGMRHKVSDSVPLLLQLSHFLPYSGLSYIGLITGSDIDKLYDLIMGDDDDCTSCFSHIQQGASLAVIWGCMLADIAMSAEADMEAVTKELHSNQAARWRAVGMLRHIFSSVVLPWSLKQQAVDFLESIIDANTPSTSLDGNIDFTVFMPSLYSSLQALEAVIMYGPDAMLRKKAFAAFKKDARKSLRHFYRQVLVDVPTSLRFDILMALVKNSDSSSMTAVLLNLVKEEMHSEITKRTSKVDKVLGTENGASGGACFWSADVLQFVEMVLRPPNGRPPSLPEFSDAVLAALNLYRYILIAESSGNTNYSGVLSKEQLRKAHREWLLPLRTLVTGIEAENRNDSDQLASDVLCALNPIVLVIYRCIELVEENLERLQGKSYF